MKIKPDVGNKNFSGGVATQSSAIRKLFVSKLESESHLSRDERHKTFVCCVGEPGIGLKEIFTLYWYYLKRFAGIFNFLLQQFRQKNSIGQEQY